jgi:DNA-binding MarR family transcriptional regulator
MTGRRRHDNVPILQLMRAARDVYRDAVREALARTGCDDIPRSALFMLAGLDYGPAEPAFSPQADVVASLGLSKQAASQLIDTLVVRGYFERRNDPADRRRMELRLAARGRTAAIAIHEAIDAVDTTVARLITAEELDGFRAGLAAYQAVRAAAAIPLGGDTATSSSEQTAITRVCESPDDSTVGYHI